MLLTMDGIGAQNHLPHSRSKLKQKSITLDSTLEVPVAKPKIQESRNGV
jgi:hypothetical protein